MKKLRLFLLGTALITAAGVAWAGSGTITVKDATGSTQTYVVTTDGSGFYLTRSITCDASAGANCGTVKAASTAAQASDLAQVVAISPNNSVAMTAASGALASGSIASGALAAGSIAAGAAVSGALADGSLVTLGLKADAATCATTNTLIACARQLHADLIATQTNQGAGAAGSAATGNPFLEATRGQTSEQTAVTTGQAVMAASDITGKRIVLPYANPENFLNGQITTAMTATTSTAVTGMGAQGAGVRNYVTACTFSNSHATVGTQILLQDGSGGTTLWQAPAAALFGGATVQMSPPIKTTANTALYAVNVTTGANTFVSCTGYKGV